MVYIEIKYNNNHNNYYTIYMQIYARIRNTKCDILFRKNFKLSKRVMYNYRLENNRNYEV